MNNKANKWTGPGVEVLAEVCARTDMDAGRIQSNDRHADVAKRRRIAFFALRLMGVTFQCIGESCGGFKHTTVMTAVKKTTPEEEEIAEGIFDKLGVFATRERDKREALHRLNITKWRELCGTDIRRTA